MPKHIQGVKTIPNSYPLFNLDRENQGLSPVPNTFTGLETVLRIRSIFLRIRIRIRGSGFENTDPDPT